MDWTQYAPNPRSGTHPVGDLLVRSDNRWKDLVYGADVPQRVLKSDFEWLSVRRRGVLAMFGDGGEWWDRLQDEFGFFKFHGVWYHTGQFARLPPGPLKVAGWDGFTTDSATTGVVVKLSSDGERYKVGTYRTKPGGG